MILTTKGAKYTKKGTQLEPEAFAFLAFFRSPKKQMTAGRKALIPRAPLLAKQREFKRSFQRRRGHLKIE